MKRFFGGFLFGIFFFGCVIFRLDLSSRSWMMIIKEGGVGKFT